MRKSLIWSAIVGFALIGGAAIATQGLAPGLREAARRRTELYFKTHFQSTLQLSDFEVLALYPYLRVTIGGVVLRHEGRTDVPPLVEISRLTFEARTLGLVTRRPVVKAVWIEGLNLRIPPRRTGTRLIPNLDIKLPNDYPITVEQIHADDVLLQIFPTDPLRQPRDFAIHHLELGPIGLGKPARFTAALTNPVPKGEIESNGKFGPWNTEDPAETPVTGDFVFQRADLGTIKGLHGILSSTGRFSGPLDYLTVEGQTSTPDFSLRTSNHPVALHTNFSAIVDGTNGNVVLNDVVARFLASALEVNGEVVDKTPKRGRTILLDAATRGARIQDLLRLAVDSNPPLMTGVVRLRTHIDIGEGDADLVERMKLRGQFDVDDAQFTSPHTVQRIETLSLKGRGRPGEAPGGEGPVSEFAGEFGVEHGVVQFSRLSFGVTGASVNLTGNYNLDSGELDFRGKLRLQAKLSQTTTGVKSFFLKPVDPFFEGKGGGTVLPIKITGSKDRPAFALDFHDKLNHE